MTVKKFVETEHAGAKFFIKLADGNHLTLFRITKNRELEMLVVMEDVWVTADPEVQANIADREITHLPTIKAAPKPAGHYFGIHL